jgi:multiple sugar transport system substrate-binding protein
MVEIDFSVMECSPGDANSLLPLMDAFEKEHHIHVNLIGINWVKGWTEIAKFGIYGHGPDLSTIGTTWIGSLAAMHSLRPFTPQQVRALGGGDAFFESNWKTGFFPNDLTPWAIPWLGDALVYYYWKDALEKAGITDLKAAFATDAALVETLKALQESGCAYPLSVNINKQEIILHEAAHWVWNAGGDLVSADGQQVIFNQPLAMQGWKNYFGLRPFISPTLLNAATDVAATEFFLRHESAVQVGGPYKTVAEMLDRTELKDQQMGVVQMPGFTFTGGTSFVMWQYSPRYQEAFELVRFLLSQPTRIPASPHSYELPTRRDAIHMPSVDSNVFHRAYIDAVQTGRSFPTMRLWGSIEEKLITSIARIWIELFDNPDQDLDACLHRHFDPLAERLNVVLGN